MTEQVRSSKVAQKLVSSIVDGIRFMSVLQRDIKVKRAEIDRLTATGQIRFASRENDLMNLSMLVMQLQDNRIGGMEADMIFMEEDDPVMQGRRRNIGEIIQDLRFLYTFDPVAQINGEYLRVVQEATLEWDARLAYAANR